MTSPGLTDWDALVVPVDDTAEPFDAGVDCSHEQVAATELRTTELPEETR